MTFDTRAAGMSKTLEPGKLRAAVEFEFNLPYPDGTRMGLAKEAIAAFEKRMGISLPQSAIRIPQSTIQ